MEQRLAITPEEFEALARECIRRMSPHQANHLSYNMAELAIARNLVPHSRDDSVVHVTGGQESLAPVDFVSLVDLLWEWVRQGHIRPGQSLPSSHDERTFNLPYFHVTASGKEFFGSQV